MAVKLLASPDIYLTDARAAVINCRVKRSYRCPPATRFRPNWTRDIVRCFLYVGRLRQAQPALVHTGLNLLI